MARQKLKTRQELEQEGFHVVGRNDEYMEKGSYLEGVYQVWRLTNPGVERALYEDMLWAKKNKKNVSKDRPSNIVLPSYRKFFDLDRQRHPSGNVLKSIALKRQILRQAGFERLQTGKERYVYIDELDIEDSNDKARIGKAYKNIRDTLYRRRAEA
jgi:hypothetical protein